LDLAKRAFKADMRKNEQDQDQFPNYFEFKSFFDRFFRRFPSVVAIKSVTITDFSQCARVSESSGYSFGRRVLSANFRSCLSISLFPVNRFPDATSAYAHLNFAATSNVSGANASA
jgi:hypothetical protein